jgi:hypothetical protein
MSTDFFTKPQPILPRMDGSNYIPRLEHAVLVVMTITYRFMNTHNSPSKYIHVYDEPTRIEARHRLESFFSAVHKMAERGDFADVSAARRFVDNTLYAIVAKIRGVIFDLRYDDSEGQRLGLDMGKILRALISQRLETIADETGYGLLALTWHLAYGDMSNNTSLSRSSRSMLANAVHGHADNDRDEVEELLQTNGFHSCSDCYDWTHEDNLQTPYNCDNDNVCNSCIENNYRYSDHYGQYVYNDSGRWALDADGDEVFIHEDDDNFSWDDDEDQYIHYNYSGRKPQLLGSYHNRARVGKQPFLHSVWTQRNDRFMGVELEVEVKDGSIDDHVETLNAKLNDGEVGKRVYFEADGSLTHGFEIITNPMGLDGHYELWSALQDRDLTRGMRSHDTSTCGLHVHVSRKNMHTMQLNKMNVFLNHPDNQELIKAVARRYDVNYARIAQKKLSNAHKYDIERRDALNITNDRTVEFRIFKGTLVHDTLLSAIEFANAVVNFTMPASSAGFHLSTQRFIDFIDSPSQRSETKHLRKHLKQTSIMS